VAVMLDESNVHTAPATTDRAPTPGRRSDGYEHLAPLFAEFGALAAGDPRRRVLRDRLIAGYQPVAHHIARRYLHRSDSLEDLEQVAVVGLILALDRFEPEREVDFLSFAVPTITGEVLRHFRDHGTAIRLPRRLRRLQGEIVDVTDLLGQRLGRTPRPAEIAAALDVPVETVLEALAARGAGHASSLDEPVRDDGDGTGGRLRFASALAWTEPEFDLLEHRQALAPLLAALPERQRRILVLRFFAELTQTEIGQHVGVSQMHISRLLSRTLRTLRRKLDAA
jgi:RNA polymerase sigma-B factor